MARAGGLDQGNIIPNLLDVSRGAGCDNYLFLAGSAINGIKNAKGDNDPVLGATAMQQAVQLFRDNVFAETSNSHVSGCPWTRPKNSFLNLRACPRDVWPNKFNWFRM